MIVCRGLIPDLMVEGGQLGFGEEPFLLEADFAAALVAVPEDEEEDCIQGRLG